MMGARKMSARMDERIPAALALLPHYLSQHVILSGAALALGLAVALPLAVVAARRPNIRGPVLALASLVQTVPGLALMALFYPLLLGLSALTMSTFGFGVPALGFLPSLAALVLYSMLPILRNAVAALTGVDPAYTEAADGVGMTRRQRLLRVEMPLAAPIIMAGIRTAAVWTIGAATLSTPVGQDSLGNFIFSGLQTENWVSVLVGCIAAVGLALIVDQLLGLVETGVATRSRRRIGFGIAGLVAGMAAALAPSLGAARAAYTIGAKNFSEQFILAEVIAQRLERAGATVRRQEGLGSAVIFRALAGGDIDAYVDYSGTLWTNVLGRRDTPSRAEMLEDLKRQLRERYGVVVMGSLGFENAYALAMQRERAAALGIRSIADLAGQAPNLKLGSDLEFLSRPEWIALRQAYSLNFQAQTSFTPTFMYRALASGAVDVISAFSSDGRIAAENLVILADPKGTIPAYDAVLLLAPRRASDPTLRDALMPLIGAITVEHMREANFMLDRDNDKVSRREAAQFLERSLSPAAR